MSSTLVSPTLVNPTLTTRQEKRHATALSYDAEHDVAPKVVAQGRGEVAEKIIQRAVEAGVPLLESELLAKALVNVELGDTIPPTLYLAIAEVLAWVYQLESTVSRASSSKSG